MKFIVKISGEVEVEADNKAAATREAREELAFEAQQHTTRFVMLDFVAVEPTVGSRWLPRDALKS